MKGEAYGMLLRVFMTEFRRPFACFRLHSLSFTAVGFPSRLYADEGSFGGGFTSALSSYGASELLRVVVTIMIPTIGCFGERGIRPLRDHSADRNTELVDNLSSGSRPTSSRSGQGVPTNSSQAQIRRSHT